MIKCKCFAKNYADGLEPQITKCPLCEAAPRMYEALEATLREAKAGNFVELTPKLESLITGALSKARGDNVH